MNVRELIEELEKVEDKEFPVYFSLRGFSGDTEIYNIFACHKLKDAIIIFSPKEEERYVGIIND